MFGPRQDSTVLTPALAAYFARLHPTVALALLDQLAAAEALTRERQAEIIRHCDKLAAKVFAAPEEGP